MRVAVLNNYPAGRGWRALRRIKRSLKTLGATPIVIDPSRALDGGFDAYLLTGTSPAMGGPPPRIKEELLFVRRADAPVLGICFGLHLIAQAFGARLVKMPSRRVGFKELRIRSANPLLDGLDGALVWENHKVRVADEALTGSSLEVLASCPDNPVEVVQVRGRRVFGVQFHPERHDEARRGGLVVLSNFLSLA